MSTARSRASLSESAAKSMPNTVDTDTSSALQEQVENAVARQGVFRELLLPFADQRAERRGWIRVAVQDTGVKLGPVGSREVERGEQVARIVARALQRLHPPLLRLHLLIFLAVGHARGLHVDEGEPGIPDGFLDDAREPWHVGRGPLGDERGAVREDVEQRV